MKKLVIAAALMALSASAQANTYVSGKNRVVIPDGCASWSCMSVSIPGHLSHNVKSERPARAPQPKASVAQPQRAAQAQPAAQSTVTQAPASQPTLSQTEDTARK